MSKIYDSLKATVNREMISKAASLVEENDSKVSSAVRSIIPGLLGIFMKKGNTAQVKNILDEAGSENILSNMNGIFCDNPNKTQQNIGDQFLEKLLGDKAADFTSAISSDSGISKVATNRLVSMLGPVVAGFLGNKLVKEKWSMADLMGELNKEKSSIMADIPSGLKNSFGLNNIADNRNTVKTPDKKKKNNSWITWLIIILLLLLLIFWWRSCRNTRTPELDRTYDTVKSRTTQVIDTVRNASDRAVDRVRNRDTTSITLSNGDRITVYRNGMEEKMVRFLNSNDYKNASADDLKSRWFEFEDINFVIGSATEFLDSDSRRHVRNISSIMKSYDNSKIRIAGYADRTGDADYNMELSEQRANYIKSLLVADGISANRITTEGFGEEKATRSENAPDDERAKDRDIAFRFIK
ncbi:MAG: OmpA family protein [Rikenellaceae bacterium]|nr:OmpA family protein [Rikenellaceae bacterium]